MLFFSQRFFLVLGNPDVLTFFSQPANNQSNEKTSSMTGDAKAGWLGVYFGR